VAAHPLLGERAAGVEVCEDEGVGVHASTVHRPTVKHKAMMLHDTSAPLKCRYPPRMIDVHRLRIFRSVVANGSIQAAADILGYTPSAVSQHVSALQRETGITLVERSGRGIRVTAAGETLAAAGTDVMRDLARLEGVVDDLRLGRTSRLTIGYFSSAGRAWMPGIVARLRAEFPDVLLELELNEVPGEQTAPDIDVTIEVAGVDEREGYERTHLVTDPYVVVVHKSHRLARRRSVLLGELATERLVDNDYEDTPWHHVLDRACEAAGFTPRYVVQSQDHHTALAFVAAGVGITVLPRLAALELPRDTRVIRLTRPQPVREIVVLTRATVAHRPVVRRAVELLLQRTPHD